MRHVNAVLALTILAAAPSVARAHPGVGIVRDQRGNVYYTDLHQVWRIAPDGRKSVVVRDVHTHELAIDSTGAVFGEDNEYLGGDRYRHRIWRRDPDGRVRDVVPWTNTFWREYGFVRDARGGSYWVRCLRPDACTVRRRGRDGRVGEVVPRGLESTRLNWIAASRTGALFLLDGDALKVLGTDGRLTTRVRRLGGAPMGMWVAPDDAVLVAVYGRREVVRVTPDGRVTTVARSPEPWGPSGVTVAPNGDLWILEYSTANAARVRRVTARGAVTVY